MLSQTPSPRQWSLRCSALVDEGSETAKDGGRFDGEERLHVRRGCKGGRLEIATAPAYPPGQLEASEYPVHRACTVPVIPSDFRLHRVALSLYRPFIHTTSFFQLS
jgi:hypothetical protein